jgi:hypothetical protein
LQSYPLFSSLMYVTTPGTAFENLWHITLWCPSLSTLLSSSSRLHSVLSCSSWLCLHYFGPVGFFVVYSSVDSFESFFDSFESVDRALTDIL